jgi:hypothetical protein
MPLHELFSKVKEKSAKKNKPVVFKYDKIPEKFRIQVFHIWKIAIGPNGEFSAGSGIWEALHDYLCRELGLMTLGNSRNVAENCVNFLYSQETDQVLDIIQASFNLIEHKFGQYNGEPDWMKRNVGLSCPPDFAIRELNTRFFENDLGYQYENGLIIRVDTQYTHSEIVEPALQLLNEPNFKPALKEFLKAHENYRHGRFEDSINESLKAFESTMKIIIAEKNWSSEKNLTASRLIQVCFDNRLIPDHLQNHFAGLRTTLESGLPATRNRYSGHGDGVNNIDVPRYLAQYALNLAATNMTPLQKG